MDKVTGFRNLKVWQEAVSLTVEIYTLTRPYPKTELFGLTNQTRRAAASVSANIAEGSGRQGLNDIIRFMVMARGSAQETISHLIVASRLGFIEESVSGPIVARYDGLCAGLNTLIKKLSLKNRPNH